MRIGKNEHVTVEFWGLKPVTGTVETSQLPERLCAVTFADNPNAGSEQDLSKGTVVPCDGMIMSAAWDAAHALSDLGRTGGPFPTRKWASLGSC